MGTLVAIPIKGRKLVNRSGRKQSPFIQLKLGEQSKRTKASLIASAEPEWDQEVLAIIPSDFMIRLLEDDPTSTRPALALFLLSLSLSLSAQYQSILMR